MEEQKGEEQKGTSGEGGAEGDERRCRKGRQNQPFSYLPYSHQVNGATVNAPRNNIKDLQESNTGQRKMNHFTENCLKKIQKCICKLKFTDFVCLFINLQKTAVNFTSYTLRSTCS